MVGSSNKHEAPGASGTMRTRSKIVNFTQPFSLSAIDRRQPAGAYTVETDEEMIVTVSFPAYRRTATWVRLPSEVQHAGARAGLDQLVNVDPAELDAALARDLAARAERTTTDAPLRPEAREPPRAANSTFREVPAAHTPSIDRGSVKFTIRDWLDANRSDLTWIVLALYGLLILGLLMPFDIPGH